MDGAPLHRVVVLVELLDEVRVHDLSEFLAVVHDCEVCLVLFSETAVEIVLVVGCPDPEVLVEVGLEWLYGSQHGYKSQIDLSVESLHRMSYVFLHQFWASLHVPDQNVKIV